MPIKILVVPDKFKGTLTAREAANSIAAGWQEARSNDQLELLPMSDGGDGFGEVLSRLIGGGTQTTSTIDAAHQSRNSQWHWQSQSRTAIIESAQVVGLALLPEGQFHPFDLDTAGLGKLVSAAADLGAAHCIIGIGGSATNDGGFGLARSVGWKFLDTKNRPIEHWSDLTGLHQILRPEEQKYPTNIAVAVDVQNFLLGENGASRIYGPQKGLRPEDMARAESCLGRLAEVARNIFPTLPKDMPGDGAAGGLGFGLRCFLGARLESGFDLFARHSGLEDRIRLANVVVTGEGAIDASTEMGKGVGEVARLCVRHGVPCIGLAGMVDSKSDAPDRTSLFKHVKGITSDLTDAEEAKRNPTVWLQRLAHQTASNWPSD